VLDVVAREMPALVPDGLVERLWYYGPPGKSVEIALRAVPPALRTPWQEFWVAFFASLRTQFRSRFRVWDWLRLPGAAISACDASVAHFPLCRDLVLKRVWQQTANVTYPMLGPVLWFRQGFSIPEDEGRWTESQFAVLEIMVGDGLRYPSVAMELMVIPFLPPGRDSFSFTAYAGEGKVSRLRADRRDPMPFKVKLRARIVGKNPRKIVVALRMQDAVRPMDIGHSIDHRLLGLFVKSVSLNGMLVPPAGAARMAWRKAINV
jgi:hypothetical protein